jgi:radical SAM-linked protein
MRLRVRFEKRGAIRFTSHKDVVRIFQRCLAAAEIPVSYSQGFHPHMRMSFGPPIKTGWEGYDEYMDLHMDESCDAFSDRINALLPEGLRVIECAEIGDGTPKLSNDISAADYEVCVHKDDVSRIKESLSNAEEVIKTQFIGVDDTDGASPRLIGVSIRDAGENLCIEYTSTMLSGRVVKPQDVVLAAVGDPETFRVPIRVSRRAQFVARSRGYLAPLNGRVIQGTI